MICVIVKLLSKLGDIFDSEDDSAIKVTEDAIENSNNLDELVKSLPSI